MTDLDRIQSTLLPGEVLVWYGRKALGGRVFSYILASVFGAVMFLIVLMGAMSIDFTTLSAKELTVYWIIFASTLLMMTVPLIILRRAVNHNVVAQTNLRTMVFGEPLHTGVICHLQPRPEEYEIVHMPIEKDGTWYHLRAPDDTYVLVQPNFIRPDLIDEDGNIQLDQLSLAEMQLSPAVSSTVSTVVRARHKDLSGLLDDGEVLLWHGRPHILSFISTRIATWVGLLIAIQITYENVGISWDEFQADQANFFFAAFVAYMYARTLYILYQVYAMNYVITDRRVIMATGESDLFGKSYPASELAYIRVRGTHKAGRGSLIFKEWGSIGVRSIPDPAIGFLGTDDVRGAMAAFMRMKGP